jgi:hypothetical protein
MIEGEQAAADPAVRPLSGAFAFLLSSRSMAYSPKGDLLAYGEVDLTGIEVVV